jgi:hypothetical protein
MEEKTCLRPGIRVASSMSRLLIFSLRRLRDVHAAAAAEPCALLPDILPAAGVRPPLAAGSEMSVGCVDAALNFLLIGLLALVTAAWSAASACQLGYWLASFHRNDRSKAKSKYCSCVVPVHTAHRE